MKEELWQPINGYVGLYEVSTYGRVRSVDRIIISKDNIPRLDKGKILKPRKHKTGYVQITLSLNSISKTFLVHRLVAQAFIPNPDNLPQINHKDENTMNNYVDNLEWCDSKYNLTYGQRLEKLSKNTRNCPKRSKQIAQYTIDGEFVAEYPSISEANRQLGLNKGSISNCCIGRQKTAYGYIWSYC